MVQALGSSKSKILTMRAHQDRTPNLSNLTGMAMESKSSLRFRWPGPRVPDAQEVKPFTLRIQASKNHGLRSYWTPPQGKPEDTRNGTLTCGRALRSTPQAKNKCLSRDPKENAQIGTAPTGSACAACGFAVWSSVAVVQHSRRPGFWNKRSVLTSRALHYTVLTTPHDDLKKLPCFRVLETCVHTSPRLPTSTLASSLDEPYPAVKY